MFKTDVCNATQLLLYAEAVKGLGNHRQALSYFKLALERQRENGKQARTSAPSKAEITTIEKVVDCYMALDDPSESGVQALKYIEMIPAKSRSIKINMQMASIFEAHSKKKSAVACYQQVLRLNPYAVEAVLALLRLEVDPRSLVSLYQDLVSNPSSIWVAKYIEAYGYYYAYKHKQAVKVWRGLCEEFPYNAEFHASKGIAEMQVYVIEQARTSLMRARELDPNVTEGTDMLALILKKRGKVTELNDLVYDLLKRNRDQPETWVAVAMYHDMTGQKDTALADLKRALDLKPTHLGAHIVKSQVLFAMGDGAAAVQTYLRAYEIDKHHLAVFEGLVEAYLSASEFKQALFTAKEALQLMPRNPKALTLVGRVLSHSPEGQEKATKAFNKALLIDSGCFDAVIAMATMHEQNKNFADALELIKRYTEEHSSTETHANADYMHTKLANVYAVSGDVEQALAHFHKALAITANYPQALSGIERLEQSMKGGAQEDSAMNDESGGGGSNSFDENF